MNLELLPPHLRERCRIFQDGAIDSSNGYVLYWMRTAVRTHENPALDVAILMANYAQVPLLVYHAISEHYEFASARHHMFMLEGARDVQSEFADKGVSYAFHLATRYDRNPHLVELAAAAKVVVTEEMPVDPPRRFLRALAEKTDTKILCVDTACVAPMQLISKPYTRAFKFRSATKQLYEERLTCDWPVQTASVRVFETSMLPFSPLDLQSEELAELVSRCEIDHAVGPVADTVGGSTAGYARWEKFKATGLEQYARRRNNALIDGVSRMSAYLHYGMVSPLRLAREAAEIDSAGSEKYLDELLIWRELAYAFCFHRDDHDQLSALPDWAVETLCSHMSDDREYVYSWEEMARSRTHDELWNAAQRSLLMHGELHNNVRMTWGKAILNWTRSPKDALRWMIDLNHRYALDGRDPASYGGLLWCMGQFDRPFEPAVNIFGTVRPRWTGDHAKRLDVESWRIKVTTPRYKSVTNVAIVGAGISGLMAARTLEDHGLNVTVFDKGRGVGGRMSTRRLDGQSTFDHGAQYFTVRNQIFRRYVDSWEDQGIVAKWPNVGQRIVALENGTMHLLESDEMQRYVGTPSMSAIGRHLALELDVRLSNRIEKIKPIDRQVHLIDDSGKAVGTFDRVIVAAPAEQAAALLACFPEFAKSISNYKMNPCWATMVALPEPLDVNWVGASVKDSILSWVARNSTKPGRPSVKEYLVLHADHQWTATNWESDPELVAEKMLAAFWKSSGLPPIAPIHLQAHRWKYAIPVDVAESRCFFDAQFGIVACGDWSSGPQVEGAFLAGVAAAGRVLNSIRPDGDFE